MSDPISIGEINFIIDETKGTPTERDNLRVILQNFARFPELNENALTSLDHSIPGGNVSVVISSEPADHVSVGRGGYIRNAPSSETLRSGFQGERLVAAERMCIRRQDVATNAAAFAGILRKL